MLRVGLTGGIACGKSVVLERLQARGLATLDLDAVAHEVMAPRGSAYADVVGTFGQDILSPDGSIDRQVLGTKVFADPTARARLEGIVHPRVRAEEASRAAELEREGHGLLVTDAALLVEAGMHLRFDRLVVVHCPAEVQLGRLMARDGLDEAGARARIAAQMPVEEKRRFGHIQVDTSRSLADTGAAGDVLAGALITEARGPRPRSGLATGRGVAALAHAGPRGPRGLDARALLEVATESEGLEMPSLGRRLRPAGTVPWYRTGRPDEGEPWPEALATPLALWALARGRDEEWLCGAAGSVARLTHAADEAVAGAVLAALVAYAVLHAGSLRPLEDRSGEREGRAVRWGGAAPPSRVRRALEAALVHRDDPLAAAAAAERSGAEPSLAAALVGAALGTAPPDADPGLVRLVAGLG
jgi:dephospho-CoA kinase